MPECLPFLWLAVGATISFFHLRAGPEHLHQHGAGKKRDGKSAGCGAHGNRSGIFHISQAAFRRDHFQGPEHAVILGQVMRQRRGHRGETKSEGCMIGKIDALTRLGIGAVEVENQAFPFFSQASASCANSCRSRC